ncbi:ArsR/SmtB family transcription factor [Succinispira mobilis]|uniref:ArsR/SmtB family transcription factor n=1 Tax=Succinispira mobilis TaxID=78120 RepID=UPI000361FB19|nr:metalloregulator ArsR/SmtB family transcription factor [Succinispira mobilis]
MNKTDLPEVPHDHGTNIQTLLKTVPSADDFKQAATVFQQLSDPTRLKILWLLCHTEECVYNIANAIDMSPPAVSHHLRSLKQSNLITNRRIGKEMHYTLQDCTQANLIHQVIDAIFNLNCPRKQTHN